MMGKSRIKNQEDMVNDRLEIKMKRTPIFCKGAFNKRFIKHAQAWISTDWVIVSHE